MNLFNIYSGLPDVICNLNRKFVVNYHQQLGLCLETFIKILVQMLGLRARQYIFNYFKNNDHYLDFIGLKSWRKIKRQLQANGHLSPVVSRRLTRLNSDVCIKYGPAADLIYIHKLRGHEGSERAQLGSCWVVYLPFDRIAIVVVVDACRRWRRRRHSSVSYTYNITQGLMSAIHFVFINISFDVWFFEVWWWDGDDRVRKWCDDMKIMVWLCVV